MEGLLGHSLSFYGVYKATTLGLGHAQMGTQRQGVCSILGSPYYRLLLFRAEVKPKIIHHHYH